MYSTLVIAPVPVGTSIDVMSRAYPVTRLELVRSCEDPYLVLDHFPRFHWGDLAIVPFRFRRPSRLCDNVNIVVGDKSSCVARRYRSKPERCVSWLGRRMSAMSGPRMSLLCRVSAMRVRPVDVNCKPRAVAHSDTDVALFDHRAAPLFGPLTPVSGPAPPSQPSRRPWQGGCQR
jgi:hypothetical protein